MSEENLKLVVSSEADTAGLKDAQGAVNDLAGESETLEEAYTDASDAAEELGDKTAEAGGAAQKSEGLFKGFVVTLGDVYKAVQGAYKALTDLTTSGVEWGATVAQTARATGLGAEATSKLLWAMGGLGVPTERAQEALKRFTESFGEAGIALAQGQKWAGPMAEALGTLGIKVDDAQGKLRPMMDIISDVAEKFTGVEDPATRSSLAIKLFGDAGTAILPMLTNGREGLAQYMEQAAKLGVALTDQAAAGAETLGLQLNETKQIFEALKIKAGTELAPVLGELNTDFQEIGTAIVDALGSEAVKSTITWLVGALRDVANWVKGGLSALDEAAQIQKGIADKLKQAALAVQYLSDRYADQRAKLEAIERAYKTGHISQVDYWNAVQGIAKAHETSIQAIAAAANAEQDLEAARFRNLQAASEAAEATRNAATAVQEEGTAALLTKEQNEALAQSIRDARQAADDLALAYADSTIAIDAMGTKVAEALGKITEKAPLTIEQAQNLAKGLFDAADKAVELGQVVPANQLDTLKGSAENLKGAIDKMDIDPAVKQALLAYLDLLSQKLGILESRARDVKATMGAAGGGAGPTGGAGAEQLQMQEAGRVTRTGRVLVHEGEVFFNPNALGGGRGFQSWLLEALAGRGAGAAEGGERVAVTTPINATVRNPQDIDRLARAVAGRVTKELARRRT